MDNLVTWVCGTLIVVGSLLCISAWYDEIQREEELLLQEEEQKMKKFKEWVANKQKNDENKQKNDENKQKNDENSPSGDSCDLE